MQIKSERKFPVTIVACFVIAAALLFAGLYLRQPAPLLVSFPFWGFVISAILFGRRQVRLDLQDNGIHLVRKNQIIPYESIDSIAYLGQLEQAHRQSPIQVCHEHGTILIPSQLNVATNDVYEFLMERFEPVHNRPLPRLLRDHLQQEVGDFGNDKVFWSTPRMRLWPVLTEKLNGRVCGMGMIFTAASWFAAMAFVPFTLLIVPSIAFTLLGTLLLIFSVRRNTPAKGIPNWQQSGLVISPKGIALMQGNLKGVMRWDELRGVDFVHTPKAFLLTAATGTGRTIRLRVEGSALGIVDIYDIPLELIYGQIMKYWQGKP